MNQWIVMPQQLYSNLWPTAERSTVARLYLALCVAMHLSGKSGPSRAHFEN